MFVHELLILISDVNIVIDLTDKNRKDICCKKLNDFDDEFDDFEINFIDFYYDTDIDSDVLEINVNYEVINNAKEFK